MIAFSTGTAMYGRTPALMQAVCAHLGFRLPKACQTSPTDEELLLAAQATGTASWFPQENDVMQNSDRMNNFGQESSSSTFNFRRDAPAYEPRAATVAAGEEPSGNPAGADTSDKGESAENAEENEVLQHPPPQSSQAESEMQNEVEEGRAADPASSPEWAPSENEGEGPPRIQPSEVPNELVADLRDFEERGSS